jgi:hypothetical protein
MMKRLPGWYLWNAGAPMAALGVLVCCVLLMLPTATALSERAQVCVVLLLAIVWVKFEVTETVPRVRQLTFFDQYTLSCFLFMFMTVVQSAAISRTRGDGHQEEECGEWRGSTACDKLHQVSTVAILAGWAGYHIYLAVGIMRRLRWIREWEATSLDKSTEGGGPVAAAMPT